MGRRHFVATGHIHVDRGIWWPRYTAEERFWMRVQKSDGCWLWTGRVHEDGYAILRRDKEPGSQRGAPVKAHRFSWEMRNGAIPEGLHVLHTCDVPLCVRPDHLYLGTQVENGRDIRVRVRHSMRQRTRCIRGHEFTEANTIWRPNRTRACRTCHNLRRSRTVDYRELEVI